MNHSEILQYLMRRYPSLSIYIYIGVTVEQNDLFITTPSFIEYVI